MKKLVLLAVLGCLLLAGCGFDHKVTPGSTLSITRQKYFYIVRPTTGQVLEINAHPAAQRDKELKELVEGLDTYVNLPREFTSQLISDGKVSVPAGVTLDSAKITVEPKTIYWGESRFWGCADESQSVGGQSLLFTLSLNVDADASPVRGEIDITLPNFALLESQGLYLLETDVLGLRPAYVAAPEVFSLGDLEVKPGPTTSSASGATTSSDSPQTVTYKPASMATSAHLAYADGTSQRPLR